MAFDPTKPVQTRDGRPARIVCTDATGVLPIVALVDDGGAEIVIRYHPTGRRQDVRAQRDDDLINIPERHVRWFNIYLGRLCCDGYGYTTKEEADQQEGLGRIACVRIEFEEGEGL